MGTRTGRTGTTTTERRNRCCAARNGDGQR
jgi:hypothetical protein